MYVSHACFTVLILLHWWRCFLQSLQASCFWSKAALVYIWRISWRVYTFGLDTVQEWIGVCNKMWNCIKNYLEIMTEAQNCGVCTGALEAGWPQTPAESRVSLSSLLGPVVLWELQGWRLHSLSGQPVLVFSCVLLFLFYLMGFIVGSCWFVVPRTPIFRDLIVPDQ